MISTMSILGLYNYDQTIFDDFHIPAALDLDILKSELLSQCAELEVLYPDPDIMKAVIDKWSSAMLYVWDQLYETTQYDYDPISNYDRTERWGDHTKTSASSSNGTTNHDTATSSRTGFNVNEGFQPSSKTESDGSGTSTGTASGDSTQWHFGKVSGNIGVTTTQHMIQEQRDIVNFNVYQRIVNDFEDRFCIMIY